MLCVLASLLGWRTDMPKKKLNLWTITALVANSVLFALMVYGFVFFISLL